MSYQPLAGVRVLDLATLVPAAETTLLLAALGADVVKVERPGIGDPIRELQADEGAPFHGAMNRGKRSIALDARDAEDLKVLLRLADAADVIVEHTVDDRWARLGLDLVVLRRQRPALVVCTLTGFGRTGPLAPLSAHGFNMDAVAGVLALDWREGQPVLAPTVCSWANELGSAHAALAITAALLEARTSGQGAWIDLACAEAAMTVHRGELRRLATATPGEPRSKPSSGGAMFGPYRCADGGVILLATLEQKFWLAFCHGVNRLDLADQWAGSGALAFAGADDERLAVELRALFATAAAGEWQRRFVRWGIPGSQVLTPAELLDHPHVRQRGLVQGEGGDRYVASAIRWHHRDERAGAGLGPAPRLDEHGDELRTSWTTA